MDGRLKVLNIRQHVQSMYIIIVHKFIICHEKVTIFFFIQYWETVVCI